jgi:hypothetical protein
MKDTIVPERKKFSFMWMTTNDEGSSGIRERRGSG